MDKALKLTAGQDHEGSFAIHLGGDDVLLARLAAEARSRGMRVIDLDLTGLADRAALVDYLAKTFKFPHETRGLDAAIDLISDLEWLGNTTGYLVLARGLTAASAVADSFVSILPNIIDRWRTQAVPFVVAVDGKGEQLQATLREENRKIERAGGLPWAQPGTGAVDVIVHGEEEPGA
jgi:hypothetical protein